MGMENIKMSMNHFIKEILSMDLMMEKENIISLMDKYIREISLIIK